VDPGGPGTTTGRQSAAMRRVQEPSQQAVHSIALALCACHAATTTVQELAQPAGEVVALQQSGSAGVLPAGKCLALRSCVCYLPHPEKASACASTGCGPLGFAWGKPSSASQPKSRGRPPLWSLAARAVCLCKHCRAAALCASGAAAHGLSSLAAWPACGPPRELGRACTHTRIPNSTPARTVELVSCEMRTDHPMGGMRVVN
jgi:hypothetical protein